MVSEGVFVHGEGDVGGAVTGVQELIVGGEWSLLGFDVYLYVLNFFIGEFLEFKVGGVMVLNGV